MIQELQSKYDLKILVKLSRRKLFKLYEKDIRPLEDWMKQYK